MMMTTALMTTMTEIAGSMGMTKNDLFRQALVSFLKQQKREVLQHRLNILTRYGAVSVADLETKIAQGQVAEHPVWEDLIVAENLAAHLEELNAYLENLRVA
ncbi:MAG: hypothetical protein KKD28_13940 [Chloroflexi bacterium]|nr:hypothetical protein [Chloroflexota bacterium]